MGRGADFVGHKEFPDLIKFIQLYAMGTDKS